MPEGTVTERLASKETGQGPGLTFEEEAELRQFLKIAKPTWSGGNDLTRVIEKLKGIGVTDVDDLLKRVTTNRINEDFTDAGFPRFSQDTLESIRKQSSFVRAMEALTEANFRQTGRFAPVPLLLSKKSIRPAKDPASSSRSTPLRPKSEPAGLSASRSEGVGGRHLGGRGGAGGPPPGVRVTTAPATSQPSPWDQEHFPMPPFSEESGREGPPDQWGHDLLAGIRHGTPGSRCVAFQKDDALPLTPVRLRHTTCPTRERHSHSASFLDLQPPLQVADPWSVPEESSRRSSDRSTPGARLDSPPPSLSRNGSDLANTWPGRHGSSSYTPERVRRPTSGAAASVSESPPRRSAASPLEDDEEEDLAHQVSHLRHQVHQICSQGSEMRNGTGAAPWRALRDSSSLLYQAEEMLQEQSDLDERKNLVRLMDKEGLVSPLRKKIACNVRERLKQEHEEGDAELETLDIHQRCTNIRKQLGEMANSRRELSMLRRAVESGKMDMSQVKMDPEGDERKQKKRDPKARDPDQVQIRSRKHMQQEGVQQAKKKEQLKESLRRHLHAEGRLAAKEIWANARRKINARLGTSLSAAELRASSSGLVPAHLKQDQMGKHDFMAKSVVSSLTKQLGQKKQWTIPDVPHEASEEDGATSQPSTPGSTPGLNPRSSVRRPSQAPKRSSAPDSRPSQAPRRSSAPDSRRPTINASQPVLSSMSENPHRPWQRSPSQSGSPKRSPTSRTTALSNALGDVGSCRSLRRASMPRQTSPGGLSDIAEH